MTDLLDQLKQALRDRYVIERELRHGGMATVYLVHDLKQDTRRGSHGGQTATED